MSKRELTLDLHPIAKRGRDIDAALFDIIEQAKQRKAKRVEIITGKGSGQLKKRVIKWLQQTAIKQRYHRVEIDAKNHGRLFIHF